MIGASLSRIALRASALERHVNPEGVTIPLFRDYDLRGSLDAIRMVYVTVLSPNTGKGPIVHARRSTMITSLNAQPLVEYYASNDDENERKLSIQQLSISSSPILIEIPPGIAVRYVNPSNDASATFIVLADYSWRPNDDESTKYDGWNDYHTRMLTV